MLSPPVSPTEGHYARLPVVGGEEQSWPAGPKAAMGRGGD